MIRIALRSDRRLFADVLAGCLDAHPEYTVVGTVSDLADLPQLCELRRPDVLVVHLGTELADDAGATLEQIRACVACARVVVLYDKLTSTQLCDLWQLGVDTLVSCARGIDTLLMVLRQCREQGADADPPVRAPHGDRLTELEERIVDLLGTGHTVAQIARQLRISTSRVANAKRGIYRKLGVGSQAQAVARAVALGIVTRPVSRRPVARDAPGAVTVDLRGAGGLVRDGVAEALRAGGIPVLDGSPLLVLVDPEPGDWPDDGEAAPPVALVLTSQPRRSEVMEALLRGAVVVISADQVVTDLAPALTLSTHGFVTLDEAAAGALLDAIRAPSIPSQRLPELTSREGDILRSIADGHTVRRTARVLGIAEKTVENTQARLFRKLGVRNRTGALAAAHALGLLESP